MVNSQQPQLKVRLDKWLWAARFFKTRALAKAAIEGGKIQISGHRAKPSKEIFTGLTITIRQGLDDKTVSVERLSEQRRGAAEAVHLYRETPESIALREKAAAERKTANLTVSFSDRRPTKKQRRQIHRFKEENQ